MTKNYSQTLTSRLTPLANTLDDMSLLARQTTTAYSKYSTVLFENDDEEEDNVFESSISEQYLQRYVS